MKFPTKCKTHINLNKDYSNDILTEVATTKFLGLQMDIKLKWYKNVLHLVQHALPLWNSYHSMTTHTLKYVYFAYCHSIISHVGIFWENSTQKKIIYHPKEKW